MDNRHMLLAFHHTPGIGWKTIRRFTECFESLSDVLNLTSNEWIPFGFSPLRAEQANGALKKWIERDMSACLERYDQAGIRWLTVWDEEYPRMLKEISDPPWVIYAKGSLALAADRSIGIVGTRTPTVYGKTTAERLSEALSQSGLCVVSGLARGIDSIAHVGALRGCGSTIAVLGNGLDTVYPAENKALFHRIMEEGLLLTEYPLGTTPHPGYFPRRNRIIAGLSLGVTVIEAALESGSLITADLALGYSRDVFAVPGPITSPKSQGTLKLIKQGAKLVTGPEDILEEYENRISLEQTAYIKGTSQTLDELSAEEQFVVELLHEEPLTIDQLLVRSQYTFGHLHAVLINLLMMRRIVELPGSVYTVP